MVGPADPGVSRSSSSIRFPKGSSTCGLLRFSGRRLLLQCLELRLLRVERRYAELEPERVGDQRSIRALSPGLVRLVPELCRRPVADRWTAGSGERRGPIQTAVSSPLTRHHRQRVPEGNPRSGAVLEDEGRLTKVFTAVQLFARCARVRCRRAASSWPKPPTAPGTS